MFIVRHHFVGISDSSETQEIYFPFSFFCVLKRIWWVLLIGVITLLNRIQCVLYENTKNAQENKTADRTALKHVMNSSYSAGAI